MREALALFWILCPTSGKWEGEWTYVARYYGWLICQNDLETQIAQTFITRFDKREISWALGHVSVNMK